MNIDGLEPATRVEVRLMRRDKVEVLIKAARGKTYVVRYTVVGSSNGSFWLALDDPLDMQDLLGNSDRIYMTAQHALNLLRFIGA